MKTTTLTLAFIILLSQAAFGTAQYSDVIIYKEQPYGLHSNPMENYFKEFPDKRPKEGRMSTALWRGYIATFEIKHNQLYLKDIEIQVHDSTAKKFEFWKSKWKSVISEVFSGQNEVKIDWFTGILVIPVGKIVDNVHMGYASTYENYVLLEIDKGSLTKEMRLGYEEYKEFKEKQFQAFKKTGEYEKMKSDLNKDKDYDDERIDRFLRAFVIDYSSKILVE